MKLLYIASTPNEQSDLMLEREITELQRRATAASGEPIELSFLPRCYFEELPQTLATYDPDVLHISCHGTDAALQLAGAHGQPVPLTAGTFRAFVRVRSKLRLVYLNACDSEGVAGGLSAILPMAIGTTAPISNATARAAAVLFYGWLFDGESVQAAFDSHKAMIESLQNGAASSRLFFNPATAKPLTERLHFVPKLIVQFSEDRAQPSKSGEFMVKLGVVGCPRNTRQIVFFTDDETFVTRKTSLENDLCWVVRTPNYTPTIWCETLAASKRDFRIAACGITSDGRTYSISSLASEGVDHYLRLFGGTRPAGWVEKTLQTLETLKSMAER